MKIFTTLVSISSLVATGEIEAQKTMSEGTLVYTISIKSKDNSSKGNGALNGATSTTYLKGGFSRTEMVSGLGSETTIYNSKTGNAVILKEYSGQKLMITLDKDNWVEKNSKFSSLNFTTTTETKTIQNYNCKKAVAKLGDGSTLNVYYSPDVTLINKDYNPAFKSLNGLPVEYEFETAKSIFTYSLTSIDFNPIASAKFDFPKAGYRVMTYAENKEGKADN